MKYLELKKNYLDPLEQEYYFKSAIRAAYDCLVHLDDSEKALIFLRTAEEFRICIDAGKVSPNEYTKFYFDFYSTDALDYIQLTLSRMRCKQMYQYYASVYMMLDKPEESMRYFDLYNMARRNEKNGQEGLDCIE